MGGLRGKGCIYIQGRFMLMYGRNQHNIVKQLSSIKNKFLKIVKNQRFHPSVVLATFSVLNSHLWLVAIDL